VRNPPTSSHTPGSETGCTIFVKLWQFEMTDRNQFRKSMEEELPAPIAGVATAILHKDEFETVSYVQIDAGASFNIEVEGGIEVLMIDGMVSDANDTLKKGSWLRLPEGQSFKVVAGVRGAKVWIKTGHLPHAKPPTV
jgi:hypothetical protein